MNTVFRKYLNFENKVVLVNTNSKIVFNHINSLNLPVKRKDKIDFTINFIKDDKDKYDLDINKKELTISEIDIENIKGGYKYYNTLKWLMRILNIIFYPSAFSFHAASFSYNGKGFLASSVGLAGKSTFAILASLKGGEYINDEYSFVKLKNNIPYVLGYPEIGAHIRVGTKKALNLDYTSKLESKYRELDKESISKVEIDDSKIDVMKIGKTSRSHKLDYILFLNMNLEDFSIKRLSKEEAKPLLRFSLFKHVFKLLDYEDDFYDNKNAPKIMNELEKQFNFSSSVIENFLNKVLDSVECYEIQNNLEISDILSCLDSLNK